MTSEPTTRNAASQPVVGIRVLGILLFLFALGLFSAWLGERLANPGASTRQADRPQQLPAPPRVDPSLIVQVLPRDSIQSIDAPLYETAAEAAAHLAPDERVIGLVINGDARAYPIPILSVHEVVNDVVGGEPVAVTWCPLCYTALVFSRRVQPVADPLTFGVSGALLYNTLVLYDRQTETLWSQLYGSAVEGELTGDSLGVFPSQLTEWSAWYARHPDSQVLSKRLICDQFDCGTFSDNPRGSYNVDPYESYYQTGAEGIVDFRIPREGVTTGPKLRVLGVRLGVHTRAYPFSVLHGQPLIQDELGGQPVLIWFDPTTETGAAFLRRSGEEELEFSPVPGEPGLLLDGSTGSRWRAADGLAIAGPLQGTQLQALFSTPAFEFGWYDYFPGSDTYEPEPDSG